MCQFLSVIVLPNGDIVADPEHTNNHEDLIAAYHLRDSIESICRVEFTPGEDPADVNGYSLRIDQEEPSWWPSVRESVLARLRVMIESMIVTDVRTLLLGGSWIITKGAIVRVAKNATIHAMSGTLEAMWGGTLEAMRGGTLKAMVGGTLEAMRGGTLKAMEGGTLKAMRGGTLKAMRGGTLKAMVGGTIINDYRKP